MKIVFLAPFGIRPKGTVLARMIPLAEELQTLGHQVVIVAPPYTNPEDSGHTEIVRGVRLCNVRLGPENKVLALPILAWRMFRTALDEKPDLIHLFKPKGYGGVAAMLHISLQLVGFRLPPLFLDTDDWEGKGGMNEIHPYSFPEKWFYQFQEKWLIRRVAGVTVASRALQSMVSEMGVAADRVCYLPNGVASASQWNRHSVLERLRMGVDEPVLLLYTRFFEFSQERLHRVFSEICRRVPNVRILVVGKGRNDEEKKLVEAAKCTGYAESLTMSGWVEPAEIPDYLAAADVAVYPLDDTLVNRCKCPAKLTELLAAGVPVVADRVGQAIEYIDDRESDLLCNPDDCSDMAGKTIRLLLDPKRRSTLADKGRRYLLENFSWREGATMLDNFYRSM